MVDDISGVTAPYSLSGLTPGLYFQFPPRQRRTADRLFRSYELKSPTYGPAPHPRDRFWWAANSYKRSVISRTGTGGFVGIVGASLVSVSQGHPAFWIPGALILCVSGAVIALAWGQGNKISAYFREGYRSDPIAVFAVPRKPERTT